MSLAGSDWPDSYTEVHEDPPHPLGPWFEQFRGDRERKRELVDPAEGAKRRRAVMTMVRDEAYFLPVWLRYYSRFFAPEDIYVIDHDSVDGSTSGEGFVRIPAHNPDFDDRWKTETVEAEQAELLKTYDMVLFVDVDEFVVPRPRLGDLGTYMDTFDEPFVNALGFEVLHLPDREPPLDVSRPILRQRDYWFASAAYNKAALATEPTKWYPGFHRRQDHAFNSDPDLLLIHLHRVDYDECRARHRRWRERGSSQRQLEAGWGAHYRLEDDQDFDRWYFTDSAISNYPVMISRIPGEIKDAF